MVADAFLFWANVAEAGLWFAFAVGFALSARRTHAGSRPLRLTAAATLALFGASDLIEAQTGAWWRPWWLLIWKSACLLLLAVLTASWYRGRRIQRKGACRDADA